MVHGNALGYAMATGGPMSALMKGTVEVDEVYIGGRQKGQKRGRPVSLQQ